MSSTTHSCHVFLPLPLTFSPSTTISLHAATQSSLFLRSMCPNHSIYHAVPHQTHAQYSTDLTTLHSFFYPSMSHHTSTIPSSSPLSPISAYPPPSLPKSHYHTPSPFVHMFYKFFLSTLEKLRDLSRSK